MCIDVQHHSAIHTLCSKFESYSDTVRLLSLWFDVQSLSGLKSSCQILTITGYIDHEIVELVVASVYLPFQTMSAEPHCATLGLLKSLSRSVMYKFRKLK
jgi:hypothetical protein